MQTLAINLQSAEMWAHLCVQLVEHIRSSTWRNNAGRGKCDPWIYFSHKMRCLIKPTSIWVLRADSRGRRQGLRSMESRPTSHCSGWQQRLGTARRARLGQLLGGACHHPPPHTHTLRNQASGQPVINWGPISQPLRCDTLSGEGGLAPAFPPAWDPSCIYRTSSEKREGGVLY